MQLTKLKNIKIIAFDLDGTLTSSKKPIETKIRNILQDLAKRYLVFIIGGGRKKQIEKQLKSLSSQKNIIIGSQSGTEIWFNSKKIIKGKSMPKSLVKKIKNELNKILKEEKLTKKFLKVYGKRYDFRGNQLTISLLGQKAPFKEKNNFFQKDKKEKIRLKILKKLLAKFKNIEVSLGGLTSIDITLKGYHKGSALEKLIKKLKIKKNEVVFFGDQIYPYGNDFQVAKRGFLCFSVKNKNETLKLLKKLFF